MNDHDDWMEMLPALDGDPFSGTGVSFLIVDVANEVDFVEQADAGEGYMVARVTIVDGELKVHLRDELLDYARAVQGEHEY